MPTLAQVRNRVDTWLAARWPVVQARQAAYFAEHGRYWQGLRTMTGVPLHTTATFADVVSDALSGKPDDQAESWMGFLAEIQGVAIPAVFVMDVYNSTEGHGYVATVWARYNGTLYTRSQNVGPETWRTVGWRVATEIDDSWA